MVHDSLCFLTHHGRPWVRMTPKKKDAEDGEQSKGDKPNKGMKPATPIDSVNLRFRQLLKELNLNGRKGLGFYTLRHVFETFGGEAKDQVAVDAIMGHVDPSMGANCRHHISDDRLRAVVNVVHDWLFPPDEEATEQGESNGVEQC